MKSFRDLKVWHRAHELTLISYRLTTQFPKHELFGLTSQIRRCSASVAANISEGCGRRDGADFRRFLEISMGSASELEYHFILGRDLGYVTKEDFESAEPRVIEVKRMLASLIQKIKIDCGK